MMKINIKALMDSQGITRYQLAKSLDIRYPTIDSIYKGNTSSIKFDVLEGLCRELNCSPNDLFVSDNPEIMSHIKGDTE